MARSFLRCLGFSALIACASLSLAQAAASHQPGNDPRHVDATQFGERITLGPNWLFAPGDDPAYASPNLDDSGWMTVSSKRDLPDYGIRNIRYCWYRLHIHLRPGADNLMAGVEGSYGAFEVYANGVRIASNGRLPTIGSFNQIALAVYPVPPELIKSDGDLLLALRFSPNATGPGGPGGSTPLRAVSRVYLLARDSAPFEIAYADAHNTADIWVLEGLSLLIGLVALSFYFTLRQGEYLACAVFLFAETGYLAVGLWQQLVVFDMTSQFLKIPFWGVANFALIEFVRLVLGMPRTRWLLGLEIAAFLSAFGNSLALSGLVPFYGAFLGGTLPILIVLILLPALLGRACIQGNREAWVLLPAVLLRGLEQYWVFFDYIAFFTHITRTLHVPPNLHLGGYSTTLRSFGGFVFFITVLLFLVVRTVAIARERARVAAEFDAARMVQQVLIPDEIPSVPGFVIHSAYKPAGEVGGDFFQILPLNGGGVLVVIGDVSGKGMPAAMIVSLLVGTVRTLAHYTQCPGEVLAAMNHRMQGRSHGGFTTCLVLRADDDGRLTIANAGHISPYLAGKELKVENGLPLGLAAESTYPESTFRLAPGAQLTMLTDGVVESRDKAGTLFGFERSAALSTEAAEDIARTAQAFGQDDDITVLTLCYAGIPVSA